MAVTPTYGMLIPGEPAATINVTVTIDNQTAQLLNSGREVLDDILILRLENGRDYYITVKATYARSCFGMNLDELVLYKDPIRTIPLDAVPAMLFASQRSCGVLWMPFTRRDCKLQTCSLFQEIPMTWHRFGRLWTLVLPLHHHIPFIPTPNALRASCRRCRLL